MKKISLLQAFYFLSAIAGAIIPWYYNISFMVDTGRPLTLNDYFSHGFLTHLTSSITSDFFIGTLPVLVWMVIEGKRIGIRKMWLIILCTFLVAFAFTCPLFLYLRDRKLQKSPSLIPAL